MKTCTSYGSKGLALLISVLIGGAALVAPAATGAPVGAIACGQTISHTTYLHSDVGPCTGEGLVIGADGITLDLGGHTVSGGVSGTGLFAPVGIDLNGHRHVTIRNGTIEGFATQVQLGEASGTVARAVVVGIRFVDGELALDGTADDSIFAFNTSDPTGPPTHDLEGGDLQIAGHGNVVVANNALGRLLSVGGVGNVVAANRVNDLYVDATSAGRTNVVTGNVTQQLVVLGGDPGAKRASAWVASNLLVPPTVPSAFTLSGIYLLGASRVMLVRNRVVAPASDASAQPIIGIQVAGGFATPTQPSQAATGNVLVGNDVSGARESGIVVAGQTTAQPPTGPPVVVDPGAEGTVLWQNVANGNGNDAALTVNGRNGIENHSTSTVFLGNVADNNANLGINSVPGVVDLGGDRASGNGNPAQCVNVVCTPG